MISRLQGVLRVLRGERRHRARQNAEKVQITNRQHEVAVKLAKRLGVTPDDLLDYRRADRILGRQR